MKAVIKRVTAGALALVLAVGLTGGALAYERADFADVPTTHWAYGDIMKMADANIIKGTSGDTFSPEMKLSAAMFLTLVSRVAYPQDVTTEGAVNWYAPWVEAAKVKGLLEGTAITDASIEGEITRYDMAVVLSRTAKALGAAEQTVDTSKIKDYADIPVDYVAAVGQTYALGLIQGDGAGKFSGALTMTRAEAATVISRLVNLTANVPSKPEEITPPEETIPPRTGETETVTFSGNVDADITGVGAMTPRPAGVLLILRYKDGRELARTTSGDNGDFTMTVTMDKADFDWYEYLYYIDATYTAPDGMKFSNIRVSGKPTLESLYQVVKGGWGISIYNNPERVDLDF